MPALERTPPQRRPPKDLGGYLEALIRPVFQAGMSWRVIDAKWAAIREAFADFEPRIVAEYGSADVERLLADPRIVRSRAKIEATIDNAQALLELDAEHAGFRRYLDSLGDFEATVIDLKRQFRFIGDSGAYQFLYVIGEQVPAHDQWFESRRTPRTRGARPPMSRSRRSGSRT